MATLKFGLDYFPLNVDFFDNDKIQLISSRFGLKGENIIIRLLCKIYSSGYFYRFSEDEAVLFAKRAGDGCRHTFVLELVTEMAKRELFDKNIYDNYKILTSAGIQRRYLEATIRRKRVEFHEQLLLIDVPKTASNVFILNQNVCIISQNGNIIRQSKGKEKEIENKIEKESESIHAQAYACTHTLLLDEKSISDFTRFQEWLKLNAPYCAEPINFPVQITEQQFKKLKKKYNGKELAEIIEQIENRKDLREKYTNLYRTILNWAKIAYGN